MVSINGFSVGEAADIGVKTFTVPGTNVLLPVRAEVAPLLIGAAKDWNDTVEPLIVPGCWGYAYRNVRGSTTLPSFHSAGIAIDMNAPQHPLATNPASNFTTAQMTQVRKIAAKYGLRWGGDYDGRKDGMHLEVILPRASALALVKSLQSKPKMPVNPTANWLAYPGKPLEVGSSGGYVQLLQRKLNLLMGFDPGDSYGVFDGHTKQFVTDFQRKHQLAADGVVGPATWSALGKA